MSTDERIEQRFWEEVRKSPLVMIGLDQATGEHSLPMTVHFEGNGPFWIFTSRGNRLVEGINGGSTAMMHYVAKGHDLFACVHGDIAIDNNPAAIDRFWNADVAAWYDGGRDDPALTLLRFNPRHAEIWTADTTVKGLMKRLFGGDLQGHAEQEQHGSVKM